MSPLPSSPSLPFQCCGGHGRRGRDDEGTIRSFHAIGRGEADRKINELLPSAIAREVAGQVGIAVQAAVQTEVTQNNWPTALRTISDRYAGPDPRGIATADPGSSRRRRHHGPPGRLRPGTGIPGAVGREASGNHGDRGERDRPGPGAAHVAMIDQLVKKEVEVVAANCARQAADDIVHEMAKDPIQQAVQRIVPENGRSQVRAEIKRLSSPTYDSFAYPRSLFSAAARRSLCQRLHTRHVLPMSSAVPSYLSLVPSA